jgi:hypothetical protein
MIDALQQRLLFSHHLSKLCDCFLCVTDFCFIAFRGFFVSFKTNKMSVRNPADKVVSWHQQQIEMYLNKGGEDIITLFDYLTI